MVEPRRADIFGVLLIQRTKIQIPKSSTKRPEDLLFCLSEPLKSSSPLNFTNTGRGITREKEILILVSISVLIAFEL